MPGVGPFDFAEWARLDLSTAAREDFLNSGRVLQLIKILSGDGSEATEAAAELEKWGLDAAKLKSDAALIEMVDEFDHNHKSHLCSAHEAVIKAIEACIADDDNVKSCRGSPIDTTADDDDKPRDAAEQPATEKPTSAAASGDADSPTDASGNTTETPAAAADDEHATRDAGNAKADAADPSGTRPNTGEEPKSKANKVKESEKDKRKREKKDNAQRASSSGVGKKSDNKDQSSGAAPRQGPSFKDIVTGMASTKPPAASPPASPPASQAADVDVDVKSHRATKLAAAVPDVPLLELSSPQMCELLQVNVGTKLPLATSLDEAQAIAMSAQKYDLVVVEDIAVECASALLTAASGRIVNLFEKCRQITAIRDGMGKTFILLRGLQAEKCQATFEQRCRVLQADSRIPADRLTPNADRVIVMGPAANFEGKGVCTRLQGTTCMSCTVHELGSKAFASHRVRLKLKRGMTALERYKLGLEVQAQGGVSGTYATGQDIVVVLSQPVRDTDLERFKTHESIYTAWAEVPPIPIGDRVDSTTPGNDEVKRAKPCPPTMVPVLATLVAGDDLDDAACQALAGEGGQVVLNNFGKAQLQVPADKLSDQSSHMKLNDIITHNNRQLLIEALRC